MGQTKENRGIVNLIFRFLFAVGVGILMFYMSALKAKNVLGVTLDVFYSKIEKPFLLPTLELLLL